MASNAIHFGTSGWRGIMADDFTFAGVRRASAAIADHCRSRNRAPKLLVGYDTRFLSESFARAAASILRSRGCSVLLCDAPAPTPAIGYEAVRRKFDGAVNITASHNPAAYNGLKFSGPNGGPALPEITRDIEARAAKFPEGEFSSPDEGRAGAFELADIRGPYLTRLAELVRFDTITGSKGAYICDAVHGCGAGWLDRILAGHGVPVTAIRGNRDVLFEGRGPDPSDENLAPLRKAVRETKAAAGLATDGDADRYGILDRDGAFISPNHILAMLFDYLIESRGWTLGASRSVATSHLVDAVARLHKVPLYETPVGFKYIGEYLAKDAIIIGGEESAGLTIRGHEPEKDGILACLLVAEMIAARRKSITEQRADLFRRVGREYWPIRVNLTLPDDVQRRVNDKLKSEPKELGGVRITKIDRTDGLKIILDGGDWVLLRPSGTEPLVRIYAESTSEAAAQRLAEEARKWIHL
ncbi:MAG TPA: phosphoglucomutase/phosphomannomutase family protein [Candidatus Acidoferrales bacterium]|nr:phosphoglucomutase/phosphomannomutase family protein [Candidatus Acidoferrales bacterium]